MRGHRPPLGLSLGALLALGLPYACASFGSANDPPPVVEAGSTVPEAAPAARCRPNAAFGGPRRLEGLGSQRPMVALWLGPGERHGYVSGDRFGHDADIFTISRPGRDGAFTDPVRLGGPLNGQDTDEESFTIFDEERGLLLEKDDRIRVARRPSASDAFGETAPLPVPGAIAGSDRTPFVPRGSVNLYLARKQDTVPRRIYSAAFAPDFSATEAPVIVADLDPSLSEEEDHPILTADELTIYFRSVRPGGRAGGPGEIWMAERLLPTGAFDGVRAVVELNTAANEYPLAVSDDGCDLYFASTRGLDGDAGNKVEIFHARRGF